jgi:hypothetical protein
MGVGQSDLEKIRERIKKLLAEHEKAAAWYGANRRYREAKQQHLYAIKALNGVLEIFRDVTEREV